MTATNTPAIFIGSVTIREHSGLYSLNDLHKASGGEDKHRPGRFLANEQTKALVSEMETAGIPSVKTREGRNGGTYACRELVIAYAAWISPAFNLKVIRVFLDTVAPQQPAAIPDTTHYDLQALVNQLGAANHQAVEQAKEQAKAARAEKTRTAERMARAHELAMEAAHSIAKQVFAAVTDESASVMLDRWLLTFDYGKTALSPKVTRINREDYVLSPAKLTEELRTGDLGGDLNNQALSQIAQAALERIAQRVNRPQTALAAQKR